MPPLTFLNSVFLAGLAAAALPILIHLFSKRQAREVRFPSLEFLQEVSRKKVRRLKLRQLLLLAMRVLIIAFFALAIARPAMQTRGGVLGRGSSTVAVILDNSFSMSARDPASTGLPQAQAGTGSSPVPEEGTVFEAAKKRALEIVSLLREGDRGLLADAARPIRLPFQTPIADLGLLRQEVERTPIAATGADLPQTVERVGAILEASKTLNRELYIISDFQRIDVEAWQSMIGRRADSTTARGHEAAGLAVPQGVKVYLVPVRTLPVENMAIERVRLDPLGAGAAGGARMIVTVANHSEDQARDVVLRALEQGQDGATLGEAFVSAPPLGRTDVTLLLRRMPASGALEVSLSPDPLPWDNRAYLVTEQPGVRRVLVIAGGTGADTDPAVRYLELALDPTGSHEFFRVDVAAADDPALASRFSADAIVLLDVGRLPDAARERLERYRAEGGGVLVVLGERTDPRTYNTAIFPKLASVELLGLKGEIDRPELFRSLRVAATGHPIFEGFPSAAGGNLTAARFRRMLEARTGSEARVLAEFSGGLPALIEDRGVLVFTSSFDGNWNDLPTSGAFVPLVHRMLQYLVAQGGGRDRLLAGSSIEEALDPGRLGAQDAFFVDPQGAKAAADRSEREGKVWLKSEPARLPGIYQLVRTDGTRLGLFAVNLDARESDLRVAPEAWLPPLFKPVATVLKPEGEITRALVEGRSGRELWPLLLTIVLILMVAESILGRGKILP